MTVAFGKLLVYLLQMPFWAVGTLVLSGFAIGWFAIGYARGTEIVSSGATMIHRGGWWKLLAAAGLLLLGLVIAGPASLLRCWPLLLIGLGCALLLFGLRWIGAGVIGVALFGLVFVSFLLVTTIRSFTGKTAVLEVRVRSVETRDWDSDEEMENRISVVVKNLASGSENTYYVYGDKWGVSANVVLFEDWVVFLGGKTYYRLNSVLGATDDSLDRHSIDDFSQPMWEELEKNEGNIPMIRAVYEDIVLKAPVVSESYTIYVDNDGALVPELI